LLVVLTSPGEDKGRVVAVYENPAIRDLRVELERYLEIQEAIRTERPVLIPDVHEQPAFEVIRRRWSQQRIAVNVQSAVALLCCAGPCRGGVLPPHRAGDPHSAPGRRVRQYHRPGRRPAVPKTRAPGGDLIDGRSTPA